MKHSGTKTDYITTSDEKQRPTKLLQNSTYNEPIICETNLKEKQYLMEILKSSIYEENQKQEFQAILELMTDEEKEKLLKLFAV